MLPEALAALHRERGNTELADRYEADAAESQRLELVLIRDVTLPGIPRVGEEVWANPNWEPVPVTFGRAVGIGAGDTVSAWRSARSAGAGPTAAGAVAAR